MTLRVIAIAYEQPVALRMLIDSFLLQTDERWRLTVVHDGPPSADMLKTFSLYSDPRIRFLFSQVRLQSYGNDHRREYLQKIEGGADDYVLITNQDNVYVPRFVELMLQQAKITVGMIYCNTVHNHLVYKGQVSEIAVGKIDGGCIIVSLPLAKAVGYRHNVGHADGLYAEECRDRCVEEALEIIHVNRFLFIHN
jgi:hypothetical protein